MEISLPFIVNSVSTAVVLLLGYFIMMNVFLRCDKDICGPYTGSFKVDEQKLIASNSQGDDIGDAFLEEIGTSAIYSCESILQLASKSAAGRKFLQYFDKPPTWINSKVLEDAASFQRTWISSCVTAGLGAIIESYGHSNGANILVETGRLCGSSGDVTRRLVETAAFNHIIITDGLNRDSNALEAIARVRLLHCMVRKHVRSACPWWDSETMGCPVSQKDGLHTIFLNSHVTIRGLELQGLPVSNVEKQSISMMWSYVGLLLGLSEDILPRSYEQEHATYDFLIKHSFSPNEVSRKLTLSTLIGASNIPPYFFSFSRQSAIARFTLGALVADSMGIEKTGFVDLIFVALMRLSTFTSWLLFSLFGIGCWFDVRWMSSHMETALLKYANGKPMWRFLLIRK